MEDNYNDIVVTGISIFKFQSKPKCIVILALGLCGTEESPYCQDLLQGLPKEWMVVTVRGLETALGGIPEKLFVKNNTDKIKNVYSVISNIFQEVPIYGVGVSMGGALLLQSCHKKEIDLKGLVMISTSLHYNHALTTMDKTWNGYIVKKIIAFWQFKRLWYHNNYLHHSGKMTTYIWLKLLFAFCMIKQDKILLGLYNINSKTYIDSLDLRKHLNSTKNIYYLLSINDQMFSPEHHNFTKDTLFNYPNVKSQLTDFGTHAEFSKEIRNDYLVKYVIDSIKSTLI